MSDPRKKRNRLRRAAVFVVIISVAFVMTRVEQGRIAESATTPSTPAAAGPIDASAIMRDVERLTAPELEGRRTGTPGSRRAQDFIVERFQTIKAQPLSPGFRQEFSFTHKSIRGLLLPSRPYRTEYPAATNLVAVIRGTASPERFLALTAHYDHFGIRDGELYPGADDNASGVAVMLAAAAAIARQPLEHSLLLIAFDAEELGLRGSRYFVEHPLIDMGQLDAIINLDMVGRGDENVLVAAGTSYFPYLREPVASAAAKRSLRVVFGHDKPIYQAGTVENWTHASDHGPFHDAGVPFLYFGVEDHADYHAATDTADKFPRGFIGETGNLVLDVLRGIDPRKGR